MVTSYYDPKKEEEDPYCWALFPAPPVYVKMPTFLKKAKGKKEYLLKPL